MAEYRQPEEKYPLTAFGDLAVSEVTPVVQISGQYGKLDKVDSVLKNGATSTVSNGLYSVSSGTNSAAYGSLESQRHIVYHAGQGGVGLFTAAFNGGAANSMQLGGLHSTSDALGFGYYGTEYGIIYKCRGSAELQQLQVTGAAGGAENATITVDGIAYTVALTAGTVQHNAYQIAVSLGSQDNSHKYSSNDDTVTCIAKTHGTEGSFSFSSGTATASWTQVTEGSAPTINFKARENWNVDTCPWIDPTKLNVHKVSFQYLGAGGISFFTEKPGTRRLALCHIIEYSNANTVPSLRNPSFKLGWYVENTGNTQNITVSGASAMGGIEGMYRLTELPRGIDSTASIGTSEVGLLAVRCRTHMSGIENMAEVFIRTISLGSDSGKSAVFSIYINPTTATLLDFSYVDESNSITETATGGGAVSGGRKIASIVVGPTSSEILSGEDLKQWLHPGETLVITAKVTSGVNSDLSASVVWQEDL